MMYPLVEDLAAEGVRVSSSCRVLGFTTQAFYKWRTQPCSDRDWSDAALVNDIIDIHRDDPEFGYRFIADELERNGWNVSENRVQRLCQQHQIWSVHAKKRGLSRKAGPPVHDDCGDGAIADVFALDGVVADVFGLDVVVFDGPRVDGPSIDVVVEN
jgi:putative transposase